MLVRAAEQWGKLDTVPGREKTIHAMQDVGEPEPRPLELGSEAGDAVPSWATSLGQPLGWCEW